MRKLLISLLLAGAAASPAIAGPHNWSGRQQASDERQQASDDRQSARDDRQAAREERVQSREESRSERSNSFAGGQGARPDRGPAQPEVRQQSFNGGAANYYRGQRQQVVDDRAQQIEQRQQVFQQRQQEIRDARDLRQSSRPTPNVMRSRNPLVVSETPRPGTQPPLRTDSYRHAADMHWDRNWQNDGHHDWRRYRNHHRSLFHLGLYYDPFGWGYQPFDIGYRMWPAYYGNQYWINAGMYGLPYPPPGATWVRYFNDAVLVDIYDGTVIDVIPGFFW